MEWVLTDEEVRTIKDIVDNTFRPYALIDENIVSRLMPNGKLLTNPVDVLGVFDTFPMDNPRPGDSMYLTEEFERHEKYSRVMVRRLEETEELGPRNFKVSHHNLEAIGFNIAALPAPDEEKNSLMGKLETFITELERVGGLIPSPNPDIPLYFTENGVVYFVYANRFIDDEVKYFDYPETPPESSDEEDFLLSLINRIELIPGGNSSNMDVINKRVSELFQQSGKSPNSGYIRNRLADSDSSRIELDEDGEFCFYEELEVSLGLSKEQIPRFYHRYSFDNKDESDIFAEEKIRHKGHLFYVTHKGLELPLGLRKYTDRYVPTRKDKFTREFFAEVLREVLRKM